MHVHSAHRASPEAAAWAGAAILVAGLSLSSSFPRSPVSAAEPPIGTAVWPLSAGAGSLVDESPESGSVFLRRDCFVLRVPDPRELAAVMRAASAGYPDALVTVAWAGERPRAMRVVAVCDH